MDNERMIRWTQRPWHWWLYRFGHVLQATAHLLFMNESCNPRDYGMPTRTTRCDYWLRIGVGIPILLVVNTVMIAVLALIAITITVLSVIYWQWVVLGISVLVGLVALLASALWLYDRFTKECPIVEFNFKN